MSAAERKARIVKVGDSVTWGGCVKSETVSRIEADGVIVDWNGGHFVSWDGWSSSPMLRDIDAEKKATSFLRFDDKDGDRVDPASYAASLS